MRNVYVYFTHTHTHFLQKAQYQKFYFLTPRGYT